MFGKSACVGGKHQNGSGIWKMRDCSLGGKWSEEYICENTSLSFLHDHAKNYGAIIAHFPRGVTYI